MPKKTLSDSRKAYMKEYLKEYGPKYAKEHPEQVIKKFNKFYCTLHGRAVHILNNAKQRTKRNGWEACDLTHEFILEKLNAGVCEATGIPFIFRTNGGKGHKTNSFSPSLDRVDNSKGYTKDNVMLVCWIYNRAKGAFPLSDLLLMVKGLNSKKTNLTSSNNES